MASTAAAHFLEVVLDQSLLAMQRTVEDNYDAERFSADGVDRSGEYDPSWHRIHMLTIVVNHAELHQAWCLLEDERSRTLMLELLLYRIAGRRHVRLSTNTRRHWIERERMRELPSVPSTLDVDGGQFGGLRHHPEVVFRNDRFAFDGHGWGLAWAFPLRQYFLRRGPVHVMPVPGDHVLDGGACAGDTTLSFALAVGDEGHVHAAEPVAANRTILAHNIAQNPGLSGRISVVPHGLGDRDVDPSSHAAPGGPDAMAPGFRTTGDGTDGISIRTIDGLVASGDVERVDFLKMDIEGSELAALRGAEATIRRFRPKLAISVYHRPTDLFEIPLWIDRLGLGYRFHLDHYTIHHEETILYADVA